MKFNLSINISQGVSDNFNYIVTPNAQKVYGNIVDSFQSGIHSFLIIGTYGTGKSSFLMALEQDLLNNKSKLVSERSVFADAKSFEFMNIVGDYSSLSTLLSKELSIAPSDDSKNVFSTLTRYLIKLKDQNKFLFIFIDEFGKILEHAANNNPEKELYFLQTLADEDYPLFFDAATSSFGDSKESDFYNVIDKIDKQCIIVTKDFITRGKVREEDINKLTCSVYRIKKVDGFDQTNMATIRTIINKIK